MKPFYSLVRIVPGPAGSDVITVGLLAHTGTQLCLRLSPYKIRLARHFFKADVAQWVDTALKQLKRKVDDANQDLHHAAAAAHPQQALSLADNAVAALGLAFKDVDYMHRYYNGVLQFSAPTPVAVAIADNVFETLYKSLVYASPEEVVYTGQDVAGKLFHDRVEKRLLNRVASKVNINLPVREYVLPGLHFQFDLDCVGINGSLVGAYAMDFSQASSTTDRKFGHYLDVITRLTHKYQRQEVDNSFYLIVDEPAATQADKVKQWRSWRECPQVSVINSQDVSQVAERIERGNAHPLVPFADTLTTIDR